jgi:hypothetical protein
MGEKGENIMRKLARHFGQDGIRVDPISSSMSMMYNRKHGVYPVDIGKF